MTKTGLSVLIPAYNEEKLLKKSTLNLYSYLKSLKKRSIIDCFEIVICVNGSTDRTEEIASHLSKKYGEIRFFCMKKRGMGIALTEGMKRAKKNIITFVDADGEILLDFIERAIPLMDKYQLINCSRFITKQPYGANFFRVFLSVSYREFFRLMFKYKFSESGVSKVFRPDATRKLIPHLNAWGGNWQMEVLYYSLKYNLKIKEIPLNVRIARPSSEVRVNISKESWHFFKTCLKYGVKIYLGF